MHSSNELAAVHDRGMVQSLRLLCEEAFSKVTEGLTCPKHKAITVYKVWTTFIGERTLYTSATSLEDLEEQVMCAERQGFDVEVETTTVYEETFGYEAIATAADKEINRISSSWDKYPAKATVPSAVKLIMAHHNAGSLFARLGVTGEMSQYGQASWEDITDIREEIEEVLTQPGAPRTSVGTKVIRDRIKDLAAMFGSPKNLHEYLGALARYKWDAENGKYHDKCYTQVSWRPGLIQWKDEATLFKLLIQNLGRPYVKLVVTRNDVREWFETTITPAELAELIGLKLAIGMRHEAIEVEEVNAADAHLRTIARWLQDRTNRPERQGIKHPKELAVQPSQRVNADDRDHGVFYCAKVANRNGESSVKIGALDRATVEVKDVAREIEVATLAKPVNKVTYKTSIDHQSMWTITEKCSDHWKVELVEKVQKTRVRHVDTKLVHGYTKATMTKLDEEGNVIGTEEYECKAPRVLTKVTMEQVIRSNIVTLPMPKPVHRDWETFLSVDAPTVINDRRLPKVNGEFQRTYVGPSLVNIERGVPVYAGRCTMHDGALWYQWKEGGKQGECPTCRHTHLTKLMIREDHWAPMIKIVNEREDEQGEKYETSCTLPTKREFVEIVEEERGKTTKEVLQFAHPGMFMPLMVPAFKRYVYECMGEGTFAAPPILEETIKHGVLRGRLLEQWEQLVNEIDRLEELGDPNTEELFIELAKLEKKRKSFGRVLHTVHLFLPMKSTLFRPKAMPAGWLDMGIRVQISGSRHHELFLVKDRRGARLRTQYVENEDGTWRQLGTQEWYQY